MSSILKALKKIDDTSRPSENHHQWPHAGALKDTLTKNIKRRWFFKRALIGFLAVVCLISLAAVSFYLRSGNRATQEAGSFRKDARGLEAAQVHRSKIAPTPPAGEPPGVAARDTNTDTAKVAPAAKPPPGARQIESAGPGQTPKKTLDRTGVSRRPPEARQPLPKVSKKAATKTAAAPVAGRSQAGPRAGTTSGRPEPPSPEEPVQYSRLQKTDLVLQAIAWSPEPAKRIAVVNGSIVREGESVAGYVLMRIRQDDIVLNDGAKSWQLDFSLQQ